jgi:uncharacterized lipoprotein YmbA
MPRDFVRNLYVTVGIPRNSHLYQALIEDMTETGLALSQVLAVRVADYYRYGGIPVQKKQEPLVTEENAPQGAAEPIATQKQQGLEARAREAAAAWAFAEES